MPDEPTQAGVGEPWRCSSCDLFVYTRKEIDGGIYAVDEPAPPSRYVFLKYPRVCNVCWEMNLVTNSTYWQKLNDESADKKRKLKSGGDYLSA